MSHAMSDRQEADPQARPGTQEYQGTDRVLLGMVLAIATFWMFANSLGTVAPQVLRDLNGPYTDEATATWSDPLMSVDQMNLAVSLTALFSGLFVVLAGGLADRFGRVRVTFTGLGLGIAGAALVLLATGALALPMILLGRALQGLSAACVMPATLALLSDYWEGERRQRAVSMWSIGSWGGAGLSAVVAGFLASHIGWRWIFVISIVISVVAGALLWGVPESRAEERRGRFDLRGLLLFLVTVLSAMVVVVFGRQLGATSPTVLGLAALAVVTFAVFVWWERGRRHAFLDFRLFRNRTFTGAVVSNFLMNSTIGLLVVSQQMLQVARPDRFSAWSAGLLTLGYGLTIIAFIRVGEKLLQHLGPRLPMAWGTLVVAAAAVLLAGTNTMVGTYTVMAVVAYALYGLGLAFYATPSTDAALASLPEEQAGAGSGIYKMASSLGSACGMAVSLAVFTGLVHAPLGFISDLFEPVGVQYNVAARQAGMVTMLFNALLALGALASILLAIPRGQLAELED